MRRLSRREIATCAMAAFVAGCAALWILVVAPSLTSRADSFAQLRKIDIVWSVLNQLPDTLAAPEPQPTQPLRERVTEAARVADIPIRRLDPQGPALSVSLDAVAFTALLAWLEALTTASAVQIYSAEIARRPEPGIVSARIVVEDAR